MVWEVECLGVGLIVGEIMRFHGRTTYLDLKVNNCARVYRLEHNYIVRYINISTTCFGPYGHLQVGYEIRLTLILLTWRIG